MLLLSLACSQPVQGLTPLSVVATVPSHGAVDVPGDTAVQIVFSDAVDVDVVRDEQFALDGPGGSVAHTLSVEREFVELRPSELLSEGQHELRIASGVWSEHVGALDAELSVLFTVGGGSQDTSDSGVQ